VQQRLAIKAKRLQDSEARIHRSLYGTAEDKEQVRQDISAFQDTHSQQRLQQKQQETVLQHIMSGNQMQHPWSDARDANADALKVLTEAADSCAPACQVVLWRSA
jgi:hypothetical protein